MVEMIGIQDMSIMTKTLCEQCFVLLSSPDLFPFPLAVPEVPINRFEIIWLPF